MTDRFAAVTTDTDRMPDTITTSEGETYYRTRYTGTTLEGAGQYGIGPGLTCHEYWIAPDNDSKRLHAVSPDKWWLD